MRKQEKEEKEAAIELKGQKHEDDRWYDTNKLTKKTVVDCK